MTSFRQFANEVVIVSLVLTQYISFKQFLCTVHKYAFIMRFLLNNTWNIFGFMRFFVNLMTYRYRDLLRNMTKYDVKITCRYRELFACR